MSATQTTESKDSKAFALKLEAHKVSLVVQLGFDVVADIAPRTGLSIAAVRRGLKALEADGKVFWDYAVNGWKWIK